MEKMDHNYTLQSEWNNKIHLKTYDLLYIIFYQHAKNVLVNK